MKKPLTGDHWAFGALRACAEAGLTVPRDVAVAGFENYPSSATGILTLTSVGQPLEEMHRLAMADLQTMLQTGKTMPKKDVLMPCELFVRESTRHQRRQETISMTRTAPLNGENAKARALEGLNSPVA